jgi:hypothetical protein
LAKAMSFIGLNFDGNQIDELFNFIDSNHSMKIKFSELEEIVFNLKIDL